MYLSHTHTHTRTCTRTATCVRTHTCTRIPVHDGVCKHGGRECHTKMMPTFFLHTHTHTHTHTHAPVHDGVCKHSGGVGHTVACVYRPLYILQDLEVSVVVPAVACVQRSNYSTLKFKRRTQKGSQQACLQWRAYKGQIIQR